MVITATVSNLRDEARNVATGRPVEVLPGIFEVRESLGPVFDTPDCWVSLWILVDPVDWFFVIAGVVLGLRAWRLADDARQILPEEMQSEAPPPC